jgi:hypothetical protein
MSTKQEVRRRNEQNTQEFQLLNEVISKKVLLLLGQPIDLQRVQVQKLWESHYRVNVIVGENITSTKIGHSYFLVIDADGTILLSTPELKKVY